MSTLSHAVLPARLESLEALIAHVSTCAARAGVDPKRVSEIEIASEEALVNVFNYAYVEGPGDVEVACGLKDEDHFVIRISDSGIPFNPLAQTEPDVSADVSHRRIGGLGILLIKKLMDEVRYGYIEGKNVLTLIIRKGLGYRRTESGGKE